MTEVTIEYKVWNGVIDSVVVNDDELSWLAASGPPYQRRAHALAMRYALQGESKMTYRQIGDRLGVSSGRANQLVEDAISRLHRRQHGEAYPEVSSADVYRERKKAKREFDELARREGMLRERIRKDTADLARLDELRGVYGFRDDLPLHRYEELDRLRTQVGHQHGHVREAEIA